MIADPFFFDNAVQQHTQHGGPHVEKVNAPGTETGGEDGYQGSGMQSFAAWDPEQSGTDETIQRHIQEGGGVTAYIEETGAGQGRAGKDLPEAGEHGATIWHEKGSDQKAAAEKQEKQSQKRIFRKLIQAFHTEAPIKM